MDTRTQIDQDIVIHTYIYIYYKKGRHIKTAVYIHIYIFTSRHIKKHGMIQGYTHINKKVNK
jgi:hypothetical protein